MHETTKVTPLRLAIVGCGAVTECLHLPALAGSTMVTVTALVDPDPARRERLARGRPDVYTAASTVGLEQHADAAIVAVPHYLHRAVATDLLEQGLHVFMEKPLAISLAEAYALVEAATRTGRLLCVGLVRRQYVPFRFVQHVLDAGWLGSLRTFDWREGSGFAWPVATPAQFRREQGGGVLFDTGAHSLDALLAWLGPFDSVAYRDDERGGVDANCTLELTLRNGVTGTVELSRTRDLRNTCIIAGTGGELEVGLAPNGPVTLRVGSLSVSGPAADKQSVGAGIHEADRRQIEAFADAVRVGAESPVPASTARESVRLFDACRQNREPLELPWEAFEESVDWAEFDGRLVLVLGATGFLGGRLVEALAQRSTARIRVLARDLSKLAGVARYPVEVQHGDVGDRTALDLAMAGSDYVFNCTMGKGLRSEQVRVNVDAMRLVVEAAARSGGVKRLVHTSTVAVYGVVKDEMLDESVHARAAKANTYGYTKWKGEDAALEDAQRLGVPIVVLQPTTVYGPGAPSWTVHPIRLLKSGSVVLVDGGCGVSNAVYVDDVVTALLRAAVSEGAVGERMLVSGPDVVTWMEFFGAFNRMLGVENLVSMNAEQIAAIRRDVRKKDGNVARLRTIFRDEYERTGKFMELPILAASWRLARKVLPRKYIEDFKHKMTVAPAGPASAPGRRVHLPSRQEEAFYRAAATVNCTKAASLIGYAPRFTFPLGMERVSAWARWANLL